MSEVNVRELRNHGGKVLDRVIAGETITIIRHGRPVAELRPLPQIFPSTKDLMLRRRHLPYVDPDQLKRDIDSLLDTSI